MTFYQLKQQLDPPFRVKTKAELVALLSKCEPRNRVGGPVGKGRITAKRALAALGS